MKFAKLYLALMHASADPRKISKVREWQKFIQSQLEQGLVPPAASGWKCPRSINTVLQCPPPMEVVFKALVDAGEPLDAYEVAKRVGILGSQAVDLIDELQQAGRVIAVGDPKDLMRSFKPRFQVEVFRASFSLFDLDRSAG